MHQMLRISLLLWLFWPFRSTWTLKFRIQLTVSFLGFEVQGSYIFQLRQGKLTKLFKGTFKSMFWKGRTEIKISVGRFSQ